MLNRIDGAIIQFVQKIVDHLEMEKHFTKNSILRKLEYSNIVAMLFLIFLLVSTISLIPEFLLVGKIGSDFAKGLLLVISVDLYGKIKLFQLLRDEEFDDYQHVTTPKEVKARKLFRLTVIIQVIFYFLLIVFFVILGIDKDVDTVPFVYLFAALLVSGMSSLITEYFLCTVTLPIMFKKERRANRSRKSL